MTVDEETSVPVEVRFRSIGGGSVLPSTLRYKVIDPDTAAVLLDWVTISPANPLVVNLPASVSAIQTAANEYERREVTFQSDFGATGQVTETIGWLIKNKTAV